MDEIRSCHGNDTDVDGKVVNETKLKEDGWKKYGDLWVKCEYGEESLSDLVIEYAKGLASLKY